MIQPSDTNNRFPRLRRLAPTIASIVAWLPVLALVIWMVATGLALQRGGPTSYRVGGEVMAEDDQFRLWVQKGYLTPEEVTRLIDELHTARQRLTTFLHLGDLGEQFAIAVYDGKPGYTRSREWYGVRRWRKLGILYHEMAHLLAGGGTSSFRMEGLAKFAEDRLEGIWIEPLPWSLEASTLAVVELLGYRPLEALEQRARLHFEPYRGLVAHRLAGAFTAYLVEEYGWERYWQLYQGGQYEEVYGRSLAGLEQEWLARMSALKRRLYAPLLALGLACVGLLVWATRRPTPWRRAGAWGAPGLLALAAVVVPAPRPALAALLLALLGVVLPVVARRWPRGAAWAAGLLGSAILIGLIGVPGWSAVG